MANLSFADLTGRGVRVAIIDSGLDTSRPDLARNVVGGVSIQVGDDGTLRRSEDYADEAGHGTACAGILRGLAPEVELSIIRIFDALLSARASVLEAALEHAGEEGAHVINASLGVTDTAVAGRLRDVCRSLQRAGICIVSAQPRGGERSFPAEFEEVIGVEDGDVRGKYGYHYRAGRPIECVAKGGPRRVVWLNGEEALKSGASYAAPHISGIVALLKERHPSAGLEEMRGLLESNATSPPSASPRGRGKKARSPGGKGRPGRVDRRPASTWMRRVVLYPYSKELHGLVRFRDLTGLEVVGVADPAGRRLVGKDAGEAIGAEPAGVMIGPALAGELGAGDTVILGYLDELGRIAKRDLLRDAIEAALAGNRNVYSLNAVPELRYGDLYAESRRRGLRLAYPSVSIAEVERTIREKSTLGKIAVPVIGFFGTSSQQGKFTAQLALRRHLLKQGYRVGQLGTEHQSGLFGFDYTFPMGYASPLELPLQRFEPFLDAKLREIHHDKKPDVLIVGSQSGTIPFAIDEPRSHHFGSLAFLLGAKPDVCVLAVNCMDPEEYVRHTIDAIRIVGKARTICLLLSDKQRRVESAHGRTWMSSRVLKGAALQEALKDLEDRFGLPAVCPADPGGQRRLAETVETALSAAA